MKTGELTPRELRVFNVMLREHNMTQVACTLNTTQPSVSKTLARLRAYFHDPLFIRVGMQMHPTPKTLQLADTVRGLLAMYDELSASAEPFDPQSSRREFRLLLTDVGTIHFLPAILRRLEEEAEGVRLLAVPMDSRQLETKLESGEADIALGVFPHASRGLRRQRLYSDTYVSVARKSHPRLGQLRSRAGFVAERHVAISLSTSGHGVHELAARSLEEQVPQDKICLRVPSFAAIAVVVMQTDAIGTMPAQLAATIAERLGLAAFPAPFPTPRVEIAQFWHERYQRDPGHQWMRALIATLFRGGGGQ